MYFKGIIMKILVIGGTGIIGSAVVKALKTQDEVIVAGSKSGDIQIDITSEESIHQAFKQTSNLDAVVITSGQVYFGELTQTKSSDFYVGINNKLMGQINTVLIGMKYTNPNASFTLTSGIINHDPILLGTNASMVNAGLEGFVKNAALEMPHNQRINLVSPTVITEALKMYAPFFAGFKSVSADEAALAYVKSIKGLQTGQVYKVGY